jgi:hypothetical protein
MEGAGGFVHIGGVLPLLRVVVEWRTVLVTLGDFTGTQKVWTPIACTYTMMRSNLSGKAVNSNEIEAV